MKRHYSSLILAGLLLTFTSLSFAQSNQGKENGMKFRLTPSPISSTPSPTVTPTPDTSTPQEKCEAKKQQLLHKIDVFTTTRDAHLHVYATIKQKLITLIETMKADKKDTTILEAQLVLLDDKMNIFSADVDDLIAQLRKADAIDCTTPDGLSTYMTDLKPYIDLVQTDVTELKQFYLNTIRPYIIRVTAPGKGLKKGWETNGKLNK